MNTPQQHKFHIPVMGLAYTIDTPIKVAKYGISSVMPIGEDRLIEMMRKYYCDKFNQPYISINISEFDYRAKRITNYLNLVNKIVIEQVETLKNSAVEIGSEFVKYFEMLPEDSFVKKTFVQMMNTDLKYEKDKLISYLRTQIFPGSIDVNILTKTDRNNFDSNGELIVDGSDAVAALRGYVNSDLKNSAIVFSAGMNPRLYNYLEKCPQFNQNKIGDFEKRIIIKVSDYRSAIIQGKYLAKKGIWVSEFRIESGLNCGGHAFATDGFLLGPILEEFKQKKQELISTIFELYKSALIQKGMNVPHQAPALKISAQGGIGTYEEDKFLHENYGIDSTGWGTPFLLVPEATTVDNHTLGLLAESKEGDVVLSNNSPLGVRFHYLKGTTAEREKFQRIINGKPGSPCTEKHLAFNTEFTKDSICTASHKYQKMKIEEIDKLNLNEKEYNKQLRNILDKECLCVGLSNAASLNYNIPFLKNLKAVTICPGPNIIHFDKVISLKTMVGHIYGRKNVLADGDRPNMFIAELNLYVKYFKEQLEGESGITLDTKKQKFYLEFYENLISGIAYYLELIPVNERGKLEFVEALNVAEKELREIANKYALKELTLV